MVNTYTVYLAEPIDQASGLGIYEAASQIESHLIDLELNIYRPANAWRCGGNPTAAIERVNRVALDSADLVVAYLPKGIPSIGVPIEIAMAAQQRKSVIVVTTIRSFSLAGIEGVTIVPRLDDLQAVVSAVCDELDKQKRTHRDMTRLYALPNQPQMGTFDLGTIDPANPNLAAAFNGPPSTRRTPRPLVWQKTTDHPHQLTQGHPDDAGIDLTTIEDADIQPGELVKIPVGVRIKLPAGVFGWVVARSSTYEKWGVLILPGIMDTGYRGPYYALALGLGKATTIPAGTRLCQVVLLPATAANYTPVEGLVPVDTTRGEGGFGSTDTGRCPCGSIHSPDQLTPRCGSGSTEDIGSH